MIPHIHPYTTPHFLSPESRDDEKDHVNDSTHTSLHHPPLSSLSPESRDDEEDHDDGSTHTSPPPPHPTLSTLSPESRDDEEDHDNDSRVQAHPEESAGSVKHHLGGEERA